MARYLLVSVGSGILFAVMDGLLNANPLARRAYKVFAPIARKSINIPIGLLIDLVYGFVLAGAFLVLQGSLSLSSPVLNGLLFGAAVWFFRVVMQAASQWMMFAIPAVTVAYPLLSGLVEMLVLGAVYGLTLGSPR